MNPIGRLADIFRWPNPWHLLLYRYVMKRRKLSLNRVIEELLYRNPVPASYAAWISRLYRGARQAKALGYDRISIIEFGIGGGIGLVVLEHYIEAIQEEIDIAIQVYGFGLEDGLPAPAGYRDLPYSWIKGSYKTDVIKLEQALRHATLIFGDVRDTGPSFFETYDPPPVAAVIFDLDYYSATMAAFSIFEASHDHYLPRVYCYFDDLEFEFTGESQAIRDFNERHDGKKIGQNYGTSGRNYSRLQIQMYWFRVGLYEFHDFSHPKYNTPLRNADELQIPLRV